MKYCKLYKEPYISGVRKLVKEINKENPNNQISDNEAEEAFVII